MSGAMPILSAVFGGEEISPEQEMNKQQMQAAMLRNRAGPQHTSVLGAILGGVGEVGQQVGSDLQEGYQMGGNFGKRMFGGGGMGGMMGGAGGGGGGGGMGAMMGGIKKMPFSFGG